jgi:hypothetical protein
MLFIVLEIPNIPLKEAKKALEHMESFSEVLKSFIWRDGIGVFFEGKDIIIKGPKISENNNITFFKEKMKNSHKKLKEENFYLEKNNIFCKVPLDLDLIEIVKSIQWIKPMKIFKDLCCRPVRKIFTCHGIGKYCGIEAEIRNFIPFSLIDYYKEKNILIEEKDKILAIQKYHIDMENPDILHNTSNPAVVFIPFEDKYRSLPEKLLVFIIGKEQNALPYYENNSLKGFHFIIDTYIENNNKTFEIAINSRLEDLLISYESDKKKIRFDNKCENKDFMNFTFQLAKELNINFQEEKLLFLINNYKNDYETSIVEEYPTLLGIVSHYVCEENKEIKDAFLSYSGEIKNDYGLIMYLSDKLYFLVKLAGDKQLATGKKDPFSSKNITDEVIKVLVDNSKNIPTFLITSEFKEFLMKRIHIYFNKSPYGNNILYENILLSHVNKIIDFLSIIYEDKNKGKIDNFNRIKNLINRCMYFIKHFPTPPKTVLQLPVSLEEQIIFVENILDNININSNHSYVDVLITFTQNMKKIILFN